MWKGYCRESSQSGYLLLSNKLLLSLVVKNNLFLLLLLSSAAAALFCLFVWLESSKWFSHTIAARYWKGLNQLKAQLGWKSKMAFGTELLSGSLAGAVDKHTNVRPLHVAWTSHSMEAGFWEWAFQNQEAEKYPTM